MMPAELKPDWVDQLPALTGELTFNTPLARYTWFKTGGPADVLFRPKDTQDLAAFLRGVPEAVPLTVIGNASNLLVRDGGIEGAVIRLGKSFSDIEIDGDEIIAGAGAADLNVARFARDHGIGGLEFLAGVPGTIGGALAMNAGAYGGEIKDICLGATIVRRDGTIQDVDPADMKFSYRHSALKNAIAVAARLRGKPADCDAIAERMREIQGNREDSQPVRTLTGGSTFKNPVGHKAWELIDAAGCRGFKRGAAVVSEKHCNFLVNEGGASAADLEGLGEEVRRRVEAQSGIVLEWEIRRIGRTGMPSLTEVTS